MKTNRIAALALALLLTVSLIGCGAATEQNAKYDSADFYYVEPAAMEAPMEMAMDMDASGYADYDLYNKTEAPAEAKPQNDVAQRKIIRNANIGYETKEYDDFIAKLTQCIAVHNGYVESSESSGNGLYSSRSRNAYLVARIPADEYDNFMTDAGTLGTQTYKSENSNDVTMNYVDTESHIRALQSEYDALLEILDKAKSLDDVLALQSRISEVNYQMDSYKSQIRKYDDLIAYCTVRISVSEVIRETKVEKTMTFGERISSGLSDTFYDIGVGASDFAVWFVTNLPYLIIWVIVIAAVVLIIRAIVKKSKKKKNEKAMKQYLEQAEHEKKQNS